ncbi:flagellar basal body P-ring formation chaperone FlgA [Shewanella sp.]|nr:flagellar basal body P-ring formation chaperone FlgA [Shewanella sp.]
MKINFGLFFIAFFFTPAANASTSDVATVPSISTISRLAVAAIKEKVAAPDNTQVNIMPQRLDSRINRPRCFSPVRVEIATQRAIKRNNTVKVSCTSPDLDYPWQIFISVKVDILYPVVVATAILGPDDLLSDSNIGIEYVEQSILRGQQFDQVSQIIGARLKRRVAAKHPIFNQHICMICKGDPVSIIARSGSFHIKTVGEALQDGNIGSKIRVRNSHSQKVITAKVSAVGQVEVKM